MIITNGTLHRQHMVFIAFALLMLGGASSAPAKTIQEESGKQAPMTNERLQRLIQKVDPEFVGRPGYWQLHVAGIPVTIITDVQADRMRIIAPVRKAAGLTSENMLRILQADFDSALDARYAIAKDILWSAFIHPLSALNDKEFLSGLRQTVNLVATYGKTYSSGVATFEGGDSEELLRRKLLEELLKKGAT